MGQLTRKFTHAGGHLGAVVCCTALLALVLRYFIMPQRVYAQQLCGDGLVAGAEECDDGNTADGDCCAQDCTIEFDGSPCDDGRGCTEDDRCLLGICRGAPGDELCARVNLDYFTCYQARKAKARRGMPPYPSFQRRRGETVADEFRTAAPEDLQQIDLDNAFQLCSPALTDATADLSDLGSRGHLESYRAKRSKTKPRQPRFEKRELGFESGLGTAILKLKREYALLVPTGARPGTTGAPLPSAGVVRRFKCYKVSIIKPKKGVEYARAFKPTTLTLTDPRGGPYSYKVGKPVRLCVPEIPEVTDATAGPVSHAGYLVCHRAKLAKSSPPEAKATKTLVSTNNAFGREVLLTRKLTELCVPAVVWLPKDENAGPFPFLTQPGSVNEAMKTIWEHAQKAPHNSAAMSTAMAEIARARDTILADLPAAQAALLDALQILSPSDATLYVSLVPLLRMAGDSPAILGELASVLMAELGPGEPGSQHDIPPEELVRRTAIDLIMYHAKQGNPNARDLILNAVQSPHLDTRRNAVRSYYALNRSRHLARREMLRRLNPEDRHLLYVE